MHRLQNRRRRHPGGPRLDADSATLENVSVAINYQCTECETLAAAYQFVFADGQEIEFTKEGKQRLHDLKRRFHDLKHRDDLTLEQLAAEIAAIAGEVLEVVETEVVLQKEKKEKESADASTTTIPGESPSTTAGASPTSTDAPTTTSANPAPAPSTTAAPATSPPTTAATSDTSPSTTAGP